jgi:thiol-disulfide isomerase/thioredoxin
MAAKCGKCQAELPTDPAAAEPEASYKMRCTECGAKNRVPGGKLNVGAKCGKCGSLLKTEELFTPQPIMISDGAVAPIIDQFGVESKGKVRVGKLNVDASPMLASKFSILSVPFIFIFDNGQVKESMPGGLQKHEIMMKMAPYV